MEVIVFGGSGFIGSHVVEQMVLAGHNVITYVRAASNSEYLKSLNVQVKLLNYSDSDAINKIDYNNKAVINCIAYRGQNATIEDFREVEVNLTKEIIEAASKGGAKRYIQLSSIIAYGNKLPDHSIDESFIPNPGLIIERAALEREIAVREMGLKTGIDTVILQPVSTIGKRDRGSFFSKLLDAYMSNKFPILGGGRAMFSYIDTRDIGRAMVWLAEQNECVKNETFLLKYSDISWIEFKQLLDRKWNRNARTIKVPKAAALLLGTVNEIINPSSPFNRLIVHALTHNRIYNDNKIRNLGFSPLYGIEEAITTASSL